MLNEDLDPQYRNFADFNLLNEEEKKELIISFVQNFYAKENKNLFVKDLEKLGVTKYNITKLFGNFQKLLIFCGLAPSRRKPNMTVEEIKNYIKQIKVTDSDNPLCPSREIPGTICYGNCTCWIIDISLDGNGRPQLKHNGILVRAHRLSYQLFKGPLLNANNIVGHKCDCKLCVNWEHLEEITQSKNSQDRETRGRRKIKNSKGSKHHDLTDPYNYTLLLDYVRSKCDISSRNEWLYNGKIDTHGYPLITISREKFYLHRLIVANKLGIKYEDVIIARHIMSDGSKVQRHDLNPDHLQNGTRKDNANDDRTNWTLTKEDIKFIKSELENTVISRIGDAGAFDLKMSQKFDVSTSLIGQIRLGKTYGIYTNGYSRRAITGYPVIQLDKNKNLICKYASVMEAARISKFSKSSIMRACKTEKSYKEFIWIFENQDKAE